MERDERANERVAAPCADHQRRCLRGPLANAEAAVCVCAAGGAGLRALSAFGVEAVGADLAAVAILVALCWHAEGRNSGKVSAILFYGLIRLLK